MKLLKREISVKDIIKIVLFLGYFKIFLGAGDLLEYIGWHHLTFRRGFYDTLPRVGRSRNHKAKLKVPFWNTNRDIIATWWSNWESQSLWNTNRDIIATWWSNWESQSLTQSTILKHKQGYYSHLVVKLGITKPLKHKQGYYSHLVVKLGITMPNSKYHSETQTGIL